MAKDVIVVVQRDALPKQKDSLDILLISTTGAYPVGEYRSIEDVQAVYGDEGPCPNSKIVRKATTLFNQGKTTLAETLVNKFKIVSFDPPKSVAATSATFSAAFPSEDMPATLPTNTPLWVKFGGDDTAIIPITTAKESNKWAYIASLLDGKSFTKNGVTYGVKANSAAVICTSTLEGPVDTIPEIFNIYTDEQLTNELEFSCAVNFVNGSNSKSAADSFIDAIKQFQSDVDNDWYYFMTDKEEDEFVTALAKFAEASEPTEVELQSGIEDHRKFYMGQTSNKEFSCETARAAVIYADAENLNEEPDASYTGNVAPFYPESVTWKFKRPQNGNASSNDGAKLITLPPLREGERNKLLDNHVNFLTEEYKRQYVKDGTCLNGEYIDVVLGGDWIANRMRNLLYDILLTNANINYDDAGFGLIGTAVLQALSEAVDYNIIAVDPETKSGVFSVIIPKYSDSTEEQRRNRIVPDISWEALLSGAVHQVKAKGTLRATL